MFRQVPLTYFNAAARSFHHSFFGSQLKYMVRVLATTVLSHISKASMKNCEYVAKALVQKFPFLQEYVSCVVCVCCVYVCMCVRTCMYVLGLLFQDSWTQFIYVRCQNCNCRAPSIHSEPKLKRQKVDSRETCVSFFRRRSGR